MPKTIGEAPGTLPHHAKEIWVAAFNSAWDGTCKTEGDRRDECAARIAWSAVKRDYKQVGDKWVKKSDIQVDLDELSLSDLEADYMADFIVAKTSSADGELRWMGRASDVFEDDLGTRMTKTLFMNFIRRSEFYGNPYLGLAHYGSLKGEGVAGPTTTMWIDGSMFKARGTFNQTSLGLALYGALNTERSAKSLDPETRIRLSLGFLDLKHAHGSFVFERRSLFDECPFCQAADLPSTFLDGILVHFAATRVPLNRRTSLELDEEREVMRSAGNGVTRFEDAASIVGEALATKLEALRLESEGDPDVELSETVVEMSGTQTVVEESQTPPKIKEVTMPNDLNVQLGEQETPEEETLSETTPVEAAPISPAAAVPTPAPAAPVIPTAPVAPSPAPVETPVVSAMTESLQPVQAAIAAFSQSVVETLQSPGLDREARLQQIRPALEQMSAAVVQGAEIASSDPQTQLVSAFRSALRDEMGPLVQGLQQVVIALSAPTATTPGRRTYGYGPMSPTAPTTPAEQPSQLKSLARRSVGLDQEPTT